MKRALVTGATGTVGSAIVAKLLSDGVPVRCLVRNQRLAQLTIGDRCELVVGDVLDAMSLRQAASGCDAIFHAAGLPQQWLSQPKLFHRVNVEGTRNALTAAIAAQVSAFVYISTQDVLDLSRSRYDESRVRHHIRGSAYFRSKVESQALVDGAAAVGLPVRSLHPAAVYGGGALAPTGLSAFLLKTCIGRKTMIFRGGLSVVYNRDLAVAAVAAAGREAGENRYLLAESFQTLEGMVGTLRRHRRDIPAPVVLPSWAARPTGRFAEMVSHVTGNPPSVTAVLAGALSAPRQADCSRARKELAWTPTPFDRGVAETLVAWGIENELHRGPDALRG